MKFTVTFKCTEYYEIAIQAENADAAREEAAEMVVQSDDPLNEFGGFCDGIEHVDTEAVKCA